MPEARALNITLRSAPVLLTAGLGLLLTGILWLGAMQYAREHASGSFAQQTHEINRDIQQQLDVHSEVLRGMQGFFNNSDEVTQEEFRRYLEQLALHERYPGVQAFAFARRVRSTERGAYEARLRRELVVDFAVHPAGERVEYLTLEYMHPSARNRAWLGFDLLADPAHLPALTRARDSGQMAVSERLALPGVDEGTAAFCLSAPVYRGGVMPQSPEEHRAAMAGTVNLIFRLKDMMAGIVSPEQRRQFDLEIYADEAAARAGDRMGLIHDSAQDEDGIPHELHSTGANRRYQAYLPLRIGDRDWVMVATALPPFELARDSRLVPLLVTGGGLLTTLLLSLVAALVVAGRRRIEAKLGMSEQQFRTLTQNLNGMVYRCRNDPDWSLEFASDGSRTLVGIEPAALLAGKPTYGSLIHADDSQMVWETVQNGIAARRPYQVEYRVRHADGGWRWVWEQGTGIFDEAGDLLFLEGFITDITERKFAERRLQSAEQHFRTTFEQTAVGLSQIDPVTGRIRLVNRRFAEMVEYTPEALVGMSGHDLTHPDD